MLRKSKPLPHKLKHKLLVQKTIIWRNICTELKGPTFLRIYCLMIHPTFSHETAFVTLVMYFRKFYISLGNKHPLLKFPPANCKQKNHLWSIARVSIDAKTFWVPRVQLSGLRRVLSQPQYCVRNCSSSNLRPPSLLLSHSFYTATEIPPFAIPLFFISGPHVRLPFSIRVNACSIRASLQIQ